MKEGEGIVFVDIKIPCTIYFSLDIYDYEGKLFNQIPINKYSNTEQNPHTISAGTLQAVNTMKLGETSWFNIKTHDIKGVNTEGCHLQITV